MNFPVDSYNYPSSWKVARVSDTADFTRGVCGVSWGKTGEVPAGEGFPAISISSAWARPDDAMSLPGFVDIFGRGFTMTGDPKPWSAAAFVSTVQPA